MNNIKEKDLKFVIEYALENINHPERFYGWATRLEMPTAEEAKKENDKRIEQLYAFETFTVLANRIHEQLNVIEQANDGSISVSMEIPDAKKPKRLQEINSEIFKTFTQTPYHTD